jgi:hypothetical protein
MTVQVAVRNGDTTSLFAAMKDMAERLTRIMGEVKRRWWASWSMR